MKLNRIKNIVRNRNNKKSERVKRKELLVYNKPSSVAVDLDFVVIFYNNNIEILLFHLILKHMFRMCDIQSNI